MGRPPKYKSVQQFKTAVNRYFKYADKPKPCIYIDKRGNYQNKELPEPYSVVGLAVYLHYDKAYLNQLENQRSHVFSQVITRAKQKIERHKLAGGLMGMYDSKITALDLAANCGYVVKTATEIEDKTTHEDALDEIRKKRLQVVK